MPRTIDPRVDIGHVHLKVSDIDRALGFYRDVLGFDVTQRYGDQAAFVSAGGYHHHLGLNTWESRGASPPPPGTTGLYHVAIRYPDRATLGDALRRLRDADIPISGATDHGVSEAIYLRDPDGNGIELYRDRPSEEWPRAEDGEGLAMSNAPREGVISMKPPTTATIPGISWVSHCFAVNCQFVWLKKPKLKSGPTSAAAMTQPPRRAIRKPKGIALGVHAVERREATSALCAVSTNRNGVALPHAAWVHGGACRRRGRAAARGARARTEYRGS